MFNGFVRYTVKDSELRNPTTRAAKLREIAAATRCAPNGEVAEIEASIAEYEREFSIDSETMRREVSAGARTETLPILDWLLLLKRRRSFAGR